MTVDREESFSEHCSVIGLGFGRTLGSIRASSGRGMQGSEVAGQMEEWRWYFPTPGLLRFSRLRFLNRRLIIPHHPPALRPPSETFSVG